MILRRPARFRARLPRNILKVSTPMCSQKYFEKKSDVHLSLDISGPDHSPVSGCSWKKRNLAGELVSKIYIYGNRGFCE